MGVAVPLRGKNADAWGSDGSRMPLRYHPRSCSISANGSAATTRPFIAAWHFRAGLTENRSIREMPGSAYDRAGTAFCFLRLSTLSRLAHKDAGTDEHSLGAKLTHQRSVRRGRNPTSGKVRHRQLAGLGHQVDQVVRRAKLPAVPYSSCALSTVRERMSFTT